MPITDPSMVGDNDDATQLAASSWLPILLEALPGTSALLYDRRLTILALGGPAWARLNARSGFTVGRRLSEVMPIDVWTGFGRHFGAPFQGLTVEFDYHSAHSGYEYAVSCRPLEHPAGTVRAGLLVGQELGPTHLSDELAEEIRQQSRIGCATFDRSTGWSAEAELLELLEVSSIRQMLSGLDTLVVPADRSAVREAVRGVLATGGRCTLRYRLRRPRTGDIRHGLGSVMAVVDGDGELVRAVVTHVDLTLDVVGEELSGSVARDRIRMLRRLSDLMAFRFHGRRAHIRQIADLMAVSLGAGTMIRVTAVTDGAHALDLTARSGPDEQLPDVVRGTLDGWWTPLGDPADPALAAARLYSSIDDPDWRAAFRRESGMTVDPAVTQFISAPIRHDGSTLGLVHAFRTGDRPFVSGDDDMLQVLADRIGWVITEERAEELLEQRYDEGRDMRDRLGRLMAEQRELLEQLSTVEERERLLLAEAIHDEPLQLVVAATMRLDALAGNLGARPAETEQVIVILEDAIGKLRTLITALTPPELTDGLGLALRRLTQAVFVVHPFVTVTVTGQDHVSLSPARKLNVCRIMREGLVNARKHARAGHIWLTLTEADGLVTATLRDDGVGTTDLDPRPGHLGMATMHGRAAAEDGHLEVTTAPGEGTTLTLTVPTDAPSDAPPAGPIGAG